MKKILSLILVFAMMLCLVACKGNDNPPEGGGDQNKDEKTTYVVTVVDNEGNPIPGVSVIFCPKGGVEMPWPTDAEGKASQKTSKEMTAKLTELPVGYEFDKLGQTLQFDAEGKLTITLTALAPFIIKVVDQDGNPVAGVVVQVCNDSTCVPMGSTDANGEAKRPSMNGSYAAKITELPDGYSVEDIDAYYDLVDGKVTITITKN
jgi:protocatechuate 3,4-dioxygenase beta subunit